jgi:hypothetical protein
VDANEDEGPVEYQPSGKQMADLGRRYTDHPPQPGQPERYNAIRANALGFAYLLSQACPDSREFSLALTKLEECVMWANASIARNEAQ